MFDITHALAELISYANQHLYLRTEDNIYAFNRLAQKLELGDLNPPSHFPDNKRSIGELMDSILEFVQQDKGMEAWQVKRLEYELISLVAPLPSVVSESFDIIASEQGFREACEFLYDYTIKSNYIDRRLLENNINWSYPTKKGELVISINAARAEFVDNEECPLCKENCGKSSNFSVLRNVSIPLAEEEWIFQFSPFAYCNEHFNLISAEHTPMKMESKAFAQMLEFLDYAPSYFVCVNCELKGVGASNPWHNHFQGGKTELPVCSAKSKLRLSSPDFPRVSIKLPDWYLDTIRLESVDSRQLMGLATHILQQWGKYSDKSIGLNCAKGEQHNGVAALAYKNAADEYVVDIFLRNNQEEFSPSREFSFLKSSPIGILEASGLIILPPRLAKDLTHIRNVLKEGANFASLCSPENQLSIYLPLIAQVANDCATNGHNHDIDAMIQSYINSSCEKMLSNAAVFGDNEQGEKAMQKFLKAAKLLNIEY